MLVCYTQPCGELLLAAVCKVQIMCAAAAAAAAAAVVQHRLAAAHFDSTYPLLCHANATTLRVFITEQRNAALESVQA